jgi:hypothetical protein
MIAKKTKTVQSALAPEYRSEAEKDVLRPRLETLSNKLCQTMPYVLGALENAGLTVVLLKRGP